MSELGPPKKRFGQHFLKDPNTARIVASGVTEDDVVLEIGPGRGFLTTFLAERAAWCTPWSWIPTCSRACVRQLGKGTTSSFTRETPSASITPDSTPHRTGWSPTFRTTSPRRSYCGCSRKWRR